MGPLYVLYLILRYPHRTECLHTGLFLTLRGFVILVDLGRICITSYLDLLMRKHKSLKRAKDVKCYFSWLFCLKYRLWGSYCFDPVIIASSTIKNCFFSVRGSRSSAGKCKTFSCLIHGLSPSRFSFSSDSIFNLASINLFIPFSRSYLFIFRVKKGRSSSSHSRGDPSLRCPSLSTLLHPWSPLFSESVWLAKQSLWLVGWGFPLKGLSVWAQADGQHGKQCTNMEVRQVMTRPGGLH